ncbi:hypothetical protein WJX84_001950 [Apatococcus fuscideae]|uniref:RBR-type E3 ubiquitin transferase n=1 Tax=Apatococcus fuscideae TaxID=2026836 RepID=A0AAW1RJ26_9CHLO
MEDDSDYGFSCSASETGDYHSSEDGDYGYDPQTEPEISTRRAQYLILSEEELQERQREALKAVMSVLSVPEGEAVRVLRHCKWDVNRVNEEWFADTDGLRDKVGLLDEQPSGSGRRKAACSICFDDFRVSDMHAAPASTSSAEIAGRDCSAAVPAALVTEVSDPKQREKYHLYSLRSFVEDNQKLEWCPAPGCENAVESLLDTSNEAMDVTCKCGSSFCFNCKEEAHRPVDCETVKKWVIKNSAESENLNWILANTKPCPKCKRPIEKNQGCMHMSCSQCKHEFCWLCLASWQEHGERTGGFYNCNKYETAKKRGEYDEESLKREHARISLQRYMHYYQRWAENDKARTQALQQKAQASDEKLESLSEITATPTSQLKFILDAWAQVVDCRRILKWTYAYGYYRFGDQVQEENAKEQQQSFFEFNQGQAEMYLEMLNGMVEKDLNKFLEEAAAAQDPSNAGPSDPSSTASAASSETRRAAWDKFRENLIGLTDVTRSHFVKLVQELEKGLDQLLAFYSEEPEAEAEMDEEAGASTAGPSGSATTSQQAAAAAKAPKRPKRSRASNRGEP